MAIYEQATIMLAFSQTDLPNGIRNTGECITLVDPEATTALGFQEATYDEDTGVLSAFADTVAEQMVINQENKTSGYIGYGDVLKAKSETAIYLVTFTRAVPPAEIGFDDKKYIRTRAELVTKYTPS